MVASSRTSNLPQKAIIRFPLPYKIGEEHYPGNVDEKLRCEAATYAWLQSHCPAVPTPRLLGFGFPGGHSFTALKNESFFNRLLWYFRYGISWISGSELSPYFVHRRQNLFELGYLILEFVNEGRMLSESWEEHRLDPKRRSNLYRGLSQIMLNLASQPLSRIGAWTINNQGFVSLTNRPLTLCLHQQENLGIRTAMSRQSTYTSAASYYLDLMACRDNLVRHQPNSIHDDDDGKAQLAALTTMRALLPKFADRPSREGPFALSLTDLHQSNIFVDDDWHITKIIDLEWACARPLDMLGPPSWLSGRSLDEIISHLEEYTGLHEEFLKIFKEEEWSGYHSSERTQLLQKSWETGAFWYFQALDSPSTLFDLFTDHIQPRFAELDGVSRQEFSCAIAPYWDFGTLKFIATKVKEQEEYSQQLREIFLAANAMREE
ncbi:uncharacterized protein E0L32_004266 [Thyridium curvatum]|uniref:Uncharacterized protein n=1 Tax=Thyridium curvatum TaxID=1093900 RepID=A0A507BFT3_9PEZI|nr:uncharacterized protein E0L32_004266 [Thyridium curvatum]TPX15568.1 hypothetical protein E0L32_004266 [Thyridium curvatum]